MHHSEPSMSFRGPVMDCIHIEKGLWRSVLKKKKKKISNTSVRLNGPVDPWNLAQLKSKENKIRV